MDKGEKERSCCYLPTDAENATENLEFSMISKATEYCRTGEANGGYGGAASWTGKSSLRRCVEWSLI